METITPRPPPEPPSAVAHLPFRFSSDAQNFVKPAPKRARARQAWMQREHTGFFLCLRFKVSRIAGTMWPLEVEQNHITVGKGSVENVVDSLANKVRVLLQLWVVLKTARNQNSWPNYSEVTITCWNYRLFQEIWVKYILPFWLQSFLSFSTILKIIKRPTILRFGYIAFWVVLFREKERETSQEGIFSLRVFVRLAFTAVLKVASSFLFYCEHTHTQFSCCKLQYDATGSVFLRYSVSKCQGWQCDGSLCLL